MNISDDMWHHVCVVWDGESGHLAAFKDGERKHQSTRFRAGSLDVIIEGIQNIIVVLRWWLCQNLLILAFILEVNPSRLAIKHSFYGLTAL